MTQRWKSGVGQKCWKRNVDDDTGEWGVCVKMEYSRREMWDFVADH